jgi:hypothetical protein
MPLSPRSSRERERQRALAVLQTPLVFGNEKQVRAVQVLAETAPKKTNPPAYRKPKPAPASEQQIAAATGQFASLSFGNDASIRARDVLRLPRRVPPKKPKPAIATSNTQQLDLFAEADGPMQ